MPFSNATVAGYAAEIAQDEFNHVKFLQSALGAAAVAAPDLDLLNSFIAVGQMAAAIDPQANFPASFDPFADDISFLLGAFIFEDVGVSAYRGASPLIYDVAAYIPAAAGILAVEAFHASEVRTILFQLGQAQTSSASPAISPVIPPVTPIDDGSLQIFRAVQAISSLRDSVDNTKNSKDQGITSDGTPTGTANIVPTDANSLAFARSTNQVLRIVYGMGTAAKGHPTPGTFFPRGMNGVIR